jgi:hypothetical protein
MKMKQREPRKIVNRAMHAAARINRRRIILLLRVQFAIFPSMPPGLIDLPNHARHAKTACSH